MGNVLSCRNFPCCCCQPLDVNREVRFILDPAREAAELKNKMKSLKSNREAVEEQIPELEGLPGVVVRDEVRKWIESVKKEEDEEVSKLIEDLESHTRCFRLVCCCYHAFNYQLAEQVRDKLGRVEDLQHQHDNWNGNYARTVQPLPAPEAMQEEMKKLEDKKKDLRNLVAEQRMSYPSKKPSEGFTTWSQNVDSLEKEISRFLNEQRSDNEQKQVEMSRLGQRVRDLITRGENLRREDQVTTASLIRDPAEMLQVEMKKLEDAKKDLQNSVEQQCTSDPSKMRSNRFATWLERVDFFASKQAQILEQGDEIVNMEARGQHREERIARMRAEIRDLLEEGEKMEREGQLVTERPPERVVNLPGSLPKFLVGVEENVSRVFEQLKDPEVDVIGICGMGGSGKTTLVKEIVRRLGLPGPAVHFDLVISVVVSKSPDISKIQEDIGVPLGYSRAKDRNDHPVKPSLPSDLSDRARTLSRHLSEKRFLLILDDVWKELDLGRIGVPSANHSKVLLTTRKWDVCTKMGNKLDIGLLGEADSLELFRKTIRKDNDVMEEAKEAIAVEIARKCGGLPLTIVTIASALKIRSDIAVWKFVKGKLDRCLFGLVPHMEEDVLKRLKISFDLLPRDEHRSCLLFCALYPEDRNIPISRLVRYWIGEGLLEYSGLTEWEGLNGFGRYDIVSTLEEACLLERGFNDDHVRLHDAVRDMAIWLGRGGDGYHHHKFLNIEAGREDGTVLVDEKWRDLQRVSFHGRYKVEKVVVPSRDTPPFICLQTFLLPRHLCSFDMAEDFFTLTPNLRVLDMSRVERWSRMDASHMPESLWSVSSLRHLDLSKTGIDHIPESIGCLHSLQYLDLSFTRISNIPKELGKLINLVVLLLNYMEGITSIPRCAVSPLVKLQILGLCGTPCFLLESKQGDEGQLGLKDLCNLTLLTRLSLCLKGHLDVQGLLAIAKAIREIEIREAVRMDELSMILSRLEEIEILRIWEYKGLENRLELPQGCQLNSLQSLRVWLCNGLKELPSLAHFPNLVTLYIDYCEELVQVVSGEESAAVSNSWDDHDTNMHLSLPKLEYISLRDMPKLASISGVPLHVPSLLLIEITRCPRLETPLPMIIPCKLGYGDCDGGGKWYFWKQGRRLWVRGNNVCEHY